MIKGVFGQPPGADFPRLFIDGLQMRLAGQPPEAIARVTVFVNTQRMRRAMLRHLTAGRAALLPKIRLVTDLAHDVIHHDVPPPVSALRRRLELSQLVRALLDRAPTLAAPSSIFDLADSLAALMDEMRGEGVPPERIAGLDVSGHSEHWTRTQDFIGIISQYFADDAAPDVEARQRRIVARLVAGWQANPPSDPVIVAGSTGSRGTTAIRTGHWFCRAMISTCPTRSGRNWMMRSAAKTIRNSAIDDCWQDRTCPLWCPGWRNQRPVPPETA
jgi:ATP-dependent helicase/nuclease subunit B